MDSAERSAEYLWYDEPLGTVSGVQTQLPVVLSEYRFYEKEDADTYLDLMRSTGNYFDEVIAFERGKSEKGLYVRETGRCSDRTMSGIYGYETEIISILLLWSGCGKAENLRKRRWASIRKNAQVIEEVVCPAYERLMAAVRELKGTGKMRKVCAGCHRGRNIIRCWWTSPWERRNRSCSWKN